MWIVAIYVRRALWNLMSSTAHGCKNRSSEASDGQLQQQGTHEAAARLCGLLLHTMELAKQLPRYLVT